MGKIEDLVLSIDQMQHLKELGVEVKDTAMCLVRVNDKRNIVMPRSLYEESTSAIPTLTLQEILEMLPELIEVKCKLPSLFKMRLSKGNIDYSNAFNYTLHDEYGKSMIENAYKMLCWCAENGYLNEE